MDTRHGAKLPLFTANLMWVNLWYVRDLRGVYISLKITSVVTGLKFWTVIFFIFFLCVSVYIFIVPVLRDLLRGHFPVDKSPFITDDISKLAINLGPTKLNLAPDKLISFR